MHNMHKDFFKLITSRVCSIIAYILKSVLYKLEKLMVVGLLKNHNKLSSLRVCKLGLFWHYYRNYVRKKETRQEGKKEASLK